MIVLISMKRWNQMWEGSRIYLRFSFISPWPTISWPTESMTNPFLPWKPLGTISTGLTSKSLRQWVRPTSFHESLVMQGCPKPQYYKTVENAHDPLHPLLHDRHDPAQATNNSGHILGWGGGEEHQSALPGLRFNINVLLVIIILANINQGIKTFIMFVVVIITKFSTHLHYHSWVGHGVRYRIEHGVGHGVRHGVGHEAGHGVGHGAGHGAGHWERPPSSGLFCPSTSNPPAAFIYHHQQHSWVLKHQHDSSVYICVLSTPNKTNLGF